MPKLTQRLVALFAVLAVVLAACGAGEDVSSGEAEEVISTETVPSTTASDVTNDTSEPPASSEPSDTDNSASDLPLAPDFTLTLSDGSTFKLSDAAKPVYLVFWAEW